MLTLDEVKATALDVFEFDLDCTALQLIDVASAQGEVYTLLGISECDLCVGCCCTQDKVNQCVVYNLILKHTYNPQFEGAVIKNMLINYMRSIGCVASARI